MMKSFSMQHIDNKTSISNAFKYGYSKSNIARFTNLSTPAISKILKKCFVSFWTIKATNFKIYATMCIKL